MRSYFARQNKQREKSSPRRGFILVMVLVLITLAGLSLAGLARQSLDLASEAASAQVELQRRWGMISCRRVLLPRAEKLLEREAIRRQAALQGWPLPAALAGRLELGGMQFEFLLADEEAKVNLNTIYRREPRQVQPVTQTLMTASAAGGGLFVRVRLPPPVAKDEERIPFETWGRIFDVAPSDLIQKQTPQQIRHATRQMTCWGAGRLNIRRASDPAIRALCEPAVGSDGVQELLAARNESNIENLNSLLRNPEFKPRQRTQLRQLLTDESRCHSLWITCTNRRRAWTSLVVDRPGNGQEVDRQTFTW